MICGVSAQHRTCGVDELLDQAYASDPEIVEEFLSISDQPIARTREMITLPVVVHIVYSEDRSNISDFQVFSQMDALNEAFSGHVNLSEDILDEHRDVIGDAKINFKLACSDPNGNPTNGITRTQTDVADIGFLFERPGIYAVHHDEFGGKDPWPIDQYINIWVAEMDRTLLGRSSLPFMLGDPNQDGIVISNLVFGFAGLAPERPPYDLGRTLVHEMGHYLGLNHPWGGGGGNCVSDDGIDDTPDQSEIYYDCPSELTANSCGSSDMTKNFMGYVDDACLQYFTQGQVNRMMNVLNGFRLSLLESDALDNCGSNVNDDGEILLWNKINSREWIAYFPNIQQRISMRVYNMKGQLVLDANLQESDFVRIQMSSMPSGMYIAQFEFDDRFEQRKINLF